MAKSSAAALAPSLSSTTEVVSSLLLLVAFSVLNNLVYKLTQTPDGKSYTYNTHSLQLNVEVIKLCISFLQARASPSPPTNSIAGELRSGLNFKACAFLLFLSISYACTNQMLFSIMVVADPGILSLFKSFTPVIVALLNRAMYSSRLR